MLTQWRGCKCRDKFFFEVADRSIASSLLNMLKRLAATEMAATDFSREEVSKVAKWSTSRRPIGDYNSAFLFGDRSPTGRRSIGN